MAHESWVWLTTVLRVSMPEVAGAGKDWRTPAAESIQQGTRCVYVCVGGSVVVGVGVGVHGGDDLCVCDFVFCICRDSYLVRERASASVRTFACVWAGCNECENDDLERGHDTTPKFAEVLIVFPTHSRFKSIWTHSIGRTRTVALQASAMSQQGKSRESHQAIIANHIIPASMSGAERATSSAMRWGSVLSCILTLLSRLISFSNGEKGPIAVLGKETTPAMDWILCECGDADVNG